MCPAQHKRKVRNVKNVLLQKPPSLPEAQNNFFLIKQNVTGHHVTTFNVESFLISSLPQPTKAQGSSLPPVLLVPLKQDPLVSPPPPSCHPVFLSFCCEFRKVLVQGSIPDLLCGGESPEGEDVTPPALQSLALSWGPWAVGGRKGILVDNAKIAVTL